MLIVVLLLAIVVFGIDIGLGPYTLDFITVYQQIFDRIMDWGQEMSTDMRVVWNLRMPRVIAALLAGMGLAMAGAAMQSMMKNPLADPYTTGISSGASFGATLAILFSISFIPGTYATVINAFVFSLIPMAVIVLVSKIKNASPTTMIMSGIAVMYIFNAITTMIKLWADPNDLEAIYLWSVGSFDTIRWDDLPMMFFVTLFGSIGIMLISNKLNILASGDESAKSLGIDASRLRIICLVVVSLITASIVSFTGIIGFVGLVAPHVVRLFIGSDNKFLIPASAAFGAALLLISDLVGRTIIAPSVIQVGVITSFIGGPLFLYLIIRQKKEMW